MNPGTCPCDVAGSLFGGAGLNLESEVEEKNPLPTVQPQRDRQEIERPSKREYEEEDFTATYDTRHVKAPIKTMMKEYWKTRKRVQVGEILDQANKRWQDLPESFQQKCLNHFLGKCTGPHRRTGRRCTFSHNFENISDNDTAEMCCIIGPGVKRIVEAEQAWKRRRSD